MLGNRLAVLPIKVIGILFCDNKWQKSIKKYEYSKKVIDMTVIYTLRDSLRSGDIFVRDSKKYNSFDYYLIDPIENTTDIEAVKFIERLKNTIHIPREFEINRDIDQDEKVYLAERYISIFQKYLYLKYYMKLINGLVS